METDVDDQDPLCILDIDLKPQTVRHGFLDAQDLLCLDIGILHQVRERPLLHLGDVRGDGDVELCRLHGTFIAVQYKIFENQLHIFNIRDDSVAERI